MAWKEMSSAPDPSEGVDHLGSVNIRTVVVDDSDAMRRTLIVLLRSMPVEIVGEARDADEGLRVCRDAQPDLVFLDIMMPGRSGLDVLGEIKEVCPGAHVIMLTSMAERSAVARSAKLGAHDYLLKPFNKVVLCDRVRAICEKRLGEGEGTS